MLPTALFKRRCNVASQNTYIFSFLPKNWSNSVKCMEFSLKMKEKTYWKKLHQQKFNTYYCGFQMCYVKYTLYQNRAFWHIRFKWIKIWKSLFIFPSYVLLSSIFQCLSNDAIKIFFKMYVRTGVWTHGQRSRVFPKDTPYTTKPSCFTFSYSTPFHSHM